MATAHETARPAADPAQLAQALELQRRSFAADPNPTLAVRRDRLARLRRLLRDHAAGIRDAIAADFGMRSSAETELLEQFTSLEGIAHTRAAGCVPSAGRRVVSPLARARRRSLGRERYRALG
jgi:acyl-CoA reductase-like NAD-dependent aldehyde dehydrogenase